MAGVTNSETLRKMPLFPLNTVLFPGMVLPLHIFEPRYRLMIGRCIQDNKPFGVVLIREGQEVGGPAEPYEIGTTAYITHAERQPDGRINIHTVGYQRFRIQQIEQREPYLIGLIEDFPVETAEAEHVSELVQSIQPLLSKYLVALIEAADMNVSLEEIPDDGLALAYFIAITLPLPMEEKQKILASPGLLGMLTLEQSMLRRELALLDHMLHQVPAPQDRTDTTFSMN